MSEQPVDSGGAPTAPDAAAPNSGGGGGRRRGGNRGGRRFNNRQNPGGGRGNCAAFEGREPTLKGHVYDLSTERNSEQYVKTTKEIQNWVGREYTKHTGDFVDAVHTLTLVDPVAPANPVPNDPVAFELWKVELKKHTEKQEAYTNFLARLFTVVVGGCIICGPP